MMTSIEPMRPCFHCTLSRPIAMAAMILAALFFLGGSAECFGQATNAIVQFESSDSFVQEDAGSVTITVIRTGDTNSAVTIAYATTTGLATAGLDYTPQSGTLSFGPGETNKTFSIPILDDTLAEGSETLELRLTNPGGRTVLGNPAAARLYIMDSENRGTLLDSTFNGAIGPADAVNALALQSDGKVVAVGRFARSDSASVERVIRLNSNGSRDSGFGTVNSGPNNSVFAVVLQPDGKVIIGGAFSRVGTTNRARIARLNLDGSLDTSFDPGSGVTGNASPGVYTLALQQDGKVLVGGNFDTVNGALRNTLARLNTNGSLDNSFNVAAGISSANTNFTAPFTSAIAVQKDGKVLISGQFTDVDGVSRRNIARLNSDGSLDRTFDPGTGAGGRDATVEAIALQTDGKVIIGGNFTNVNTTARQGIARLNSNGSVDPGFDPAGGVKDYDDAPGYVNALAVQTDGKILLGGLFWTVDEINRHGIARVNGDGSLDGTFGPHFGTTYRNELGYEEPDSVTALALQPDGKILIGATYASEDFSYTNRITRLLSTNVRTSSFEFSAPSTSAGESRGPVSIEVIRRGDSDQAFTLDYSTTNGLAISGADYTPSAGTLRFGIKEVKKTITVQILDDAIIEDDEAFSISLRNPSVGATLSAPTNHLVRIIDSRKPGNLDFGFAAVNIPFLEDPVSYPPVTGMVLQSDGKVVIAGNFLSVNGTNRAGVVRLNANGSIDSAFVPQLPRGSDFLDFYTLGVLPDGGIIGGYEGLNRLYPDDGSLDNQFFPDVGYANALTVLSDGKFLVCDAYTDPNSKATVYEIAQFLPDGFFDVDFSPATLDDWAYAIAVQPDGKVVIGGFFTDVNGETRNRIARLNKDGTLDTLFGTGPGIQGTANAGVFALAAQPDGKVIVGGYFSGVNNVSRINLARLNADGSVDTSFSPSVANNYVGTIALQSDGKILIGGGFSTVAGVRRLGFARLNRDGSLDTSYAPALTFPDAILVNAIVVQPDGQILIGGLFDAVNGVARAGVARLIGDANLLKLNIEPRKANSLFRFTLNTQPGKQYRIEASTNLLNWLPISTNLATGISLGFDDPNASGPKVQFYRAVQLGP
jgi:uncharacterized delta-60 repeat protein